MRSTPCSPPLYTASADSLQANRPQLFQLHRRAPRGAPAEMAAPRRLGELAAHLQPAAAAGAPFPQLSGTELPPWRGGLPGGLRLKATAGVGTNTRENRREDDGKPDNMQPGHGRKIWTIELVDEAGDLAVAAARHLGQEVEQRLR